jgi:peptidoglycan/LPS O-acetylase OafA/YrhL
MFSLESPGKSFSKRFVDAVRAIPYRFGRNTSRSYIPELDGLRCLAIAFVMLFHSSLRAARYIDDVSRTKPSIKDYYGIFPHGEIGVLLFFFLSGFIVSMPFLSKPSAEWKVREYYLSRTWRIYPPYFVAITLCYFALGILGHVPSDAASYNDNVSLNQSYLASLFYMHGLIFNLPSPLDPPMWSLEIEVLFYALLPAVVALYFASGKRNIRSCLLICVIFALTFASSFANGSEIDNRFRWGLASHSYLFLTGIVIADIAGHLTKQQRSQSLLMDFLFAFGLATVIYVGLRLTETDSRPLRGSAAFLNEVLSIAALLMIFFGGFYGRFVPGLLRSPWLRLVGTMCYSLYLTHVVAMQVVGEFLSRHFVSDVPGVIYVVFVSLMIAASLITGFVFYIFVERPFTQSRRWPWRQKENAVSLRPHL